jgi:hypothetical protein
MSAFALGGFGVAVDAPAQAVADPRGEAQLAAAVLAGAGAIVYAIGGATLIDRAPAAGAALLAGAALQAAWPLSRRRPMRAAGVLLNLALIATWIAGHAGALALGGVGPPPVDLLAALCLADSVVLVGLVALGGRAVLSQLAIVLAVASLTALAGGHVHHAPPTSSAGPAHLFYCSLL